MASEVIDALDDLVDGSSWQVQVPLITSVVEADPDADEMAHTPHSRSRGRHPVEISDQRRFGFLVVRQIFRRAAHCEGIQDGTGVIE